jgi:3',5'-cyclic AMP phosphodiesterase CpdA
VTGEEYSILVGGDSHVGGTQNLRKLIEIAERDGAAAVVIAGDLCTGRAEDYEVAVVELNASGEIPVCVVPGNHDLYFGGWSSFYDYFGASVYTFTVETSSASDLYIFLDSGGGTLGTDQMEWLKSLLSERREEYRHAVVVTHVNFFRNRFTTSTNILNEELLVLLDLFARHEINLVIQGHDHKRYEEVFGPTTYITLDAMKDDNEDASFLELAVKPDEIGYSFIDF